MNIALKISALCIAFHSVVTFANTSTVYVNGDILTMQGDAPQYVEANPPNTKAQASNKLLTEGKPFNGWILSFGYSEAMLSDGAPSALL